MATYSIGLTGGVASGKSSVADAFARLDIVIVDADRAARDAVARGSDGLAEVVAAFGEEVLDGDGHLDRAAMRRRIFEDESARRTLESIVHPRVRSALRRTAGTTRGPYVVVAIPLLAESGGREAYPWLDRVLLIDVPTDVQAVRLLQRDAVDDALAARMIAAQADRFARLAVADDVLVNTGTVDELARRVAALDRQYRTLATS